MMRSSLLRILSTLLLLPLIALSAPSLLLARSICSTLPVTSDNQESVTVTSVSEISDEINRATGPKTIFLEDGTYHVSPSSVIHVNKPGITIRSKSGDRDRVLIVGQGMRNGVEVGHGFFISSSNTTIADLTIRDIRNHAIFINPGSHRNLIHNVRCLDCGEQLLKASGGSELPPKNDSTVQCSSFEYSDTLDDGDDGWYTNGIDLLNSHNWVIRYNLFKNIRHNPALTSTLAGPAILVWQSSSGTLIEGNQIINCDFGISLGNASGEGVQHDGGVIVNNFIKGYNKSDFGIGIIRSINSRVEHNTIYSPGSWPYSIEARFPETRNAIIRNNFVDEPILPDRDGADVQVRNNLTKAKPSYFRDARSGDLHLHSRRAPALDCTTSLKSRTYDIDQEQIDDLKPDCGADELNN